MRIRVLCLLSAILLMAIPLASQNVDLAHPGELSAQKHSTPEEMRDRVARLQLQKDAKELSDLCASIPSDMEGVKNGVLQKDVVEKLKRVEKLSKRVREGLTQASTTP